MAFDFVIGTHKGIHADVTGHTATSMCTKAITDNEHESLQAALARLGGISKGVVVLLIVTAATVLPCGEVLLLDEGGINGR